MSIALWLLMALVLTLLCWHELPLMPRSGLDTSWEGALHMALHERVTFGDHLIFTYGPLGFLSVPTLWYGDTGTIAVLYAVLLRLALALALFLAARRSYGTIVGAIIAFLVLDTGTVSRETVLFLVYAVWMLDRSPVSEEADRPSLADPRRRFVPTRQLALMAVGGGVAGVELLIKQSIGLEITVLALIVALASTGRRLQQLIVMLLALIAALLVGWVATGQHLGALPAYAGNAIQIISGYAAAMSYRNPRRFVVFFEYAGALLAFAIGLVGAWQASVDRAASRRWGTIALWVAFCFFEYKEGFVRHTAGNAAIFFIALTGGFLALRWRVGGRALGLALVFTLLILALSALVLRGKMYSVRSLDPATNASSAITQLRELASSSESSSITAQGRQRIKATYPIDQTTLGLLQGEGVHLSPYQTSIVWAYDLKWHPLPVFQSYAAYTTSLDHSDAAALRSTRAPARILRNLDPELDARVQAFDEGEATRTILCRYRELRTTETWQVLGLGADRCGAIVPLGTVRAGWRQKVLVPAPPNDHSFVFVRIGGVTVGGLERLVALLYKPRERLVRLVGHPPHRLVEGTAADGLLMRAPAGVDFTAPFNLAPNSPTIAVIEAGQFGGGKPLSFSFFAQSVSEGPRGRGAARPARSAPAPRRARA